MTNRPANTGKSMLIKEILANPDTSVSYCHCASIVRTPSGDLLAAWYAYRSEETRNGTLVQARRQAGANRFERPRRIWQTHFFGSDPVSKNHETTEFPKMIQMLPRRGPAFGVRRPHQQLQPGHDSGLLRTGDARMGGQAIVRRAASAMGV